LQRSSVTGGERSEYLMGVPVQKEHTVKYDRATRWLHAGISLGVVIQLSTSVLMSVPRPGGPLQEPGFHMCEVHRWSGICVAGLVLLHWLWLLTGHVTGGWGHLFPWFSAPRLRALVADVKELPNWFRGAFPGQQEETTPLAGAVHGLGLLLISCMAVAGAVIFFRMGPHGSMSRFVATVREIHMFAGEVLWVYLAGHVGMALLHQLRGDRLITDMFNLVRE
jgi:cytochrome b561